MHQNGLEIIWFKRGKMSKVIKKSYPKKGVLLELNQEYNKYGCPKRYWKLWVKIKDNRWLEVHGILIDKKEAMNFYRLIYSYLKGKGEKDEK